MFFWDVLFPGVMLVSGRLSFMILSPTLYRFDCFKQHVHPSAQSANRLAPKSQCCTAIPAIRSMSGLRLLGEVQLISNLYLVY